MLKISKPLLAITFTLSVLFIAFMLNKAFPALDYLKSHAYLEKTNLHKIGYGQKPTDNLGLSVKSNIITIGAIASNMEKANYKLDSASNSFESMAGVAREQNIPLDKEQIEEAHINDARHESALKLKPPSVEEKIVSWFFKKTEMDSEIEKEIATKNASFAYLNFTNLQKINAPIFNQYDLSSFYTQQKKLLQMQKVASHISSEHAVKLKTAEKIVLSVYANANTHSLDPNLLFAVIQSESTFKPMAFSSAQAQGLMQVIPKYHKEELKTIQAKNLDIYSIDGNIELGTMVLKKYIKLNKGNVTKALQMYNGSFHDQTKKYSKKVLKYTDDFTRLVKASNLKGT